MKIVTVGRLSKEKAKTLQLKFYQCYVKKDMKYDGTVLEKERIERITRH